MLFVLLITKKHLIQSIKQNFGKHSIISQTWIHPKSIYKLKNMNMQNVK